MKRFYLRNDFLEMIEPWLWGRELWFANALRPLKADNRDEFKTLIEKYGVDEPFHFFLSVEIFNNPLKLGFERPEVLRINWDFFLDIDSEDFSTARRAASKVLKTLEIFNIENYVLKFSGRRGFHLIIPSLGLYDSMLGEFKMAYPRLAVDLAKWFQAIVNEPAVKFDLSVYKPRQMMRAPYSIHEKTRLVSVPVKDPFEFKVEDAKIENVKEIAPLPRYPGDIRELLASLRDWLMEYSEETGLKVISKGEIEGGKAEAYGWIERLLENPIDDGRHRLLWLVVAPYLVNVKRLPVDEAEKIAYNWLIKCSEKRPIEGDLSRLAKYYVEYAVRVGLRPLSLKTIREKPEYKELYEIIKATGISKGRETIPTYLLRVESLQKREAEYEVEKPLLAEIRAVYREVKKTFDKYPESKHWRENEKRNMILGWLAERVFNMILDQLQIPHVWHHPLIQNELVKDKERIGADFTVYNETIDIKTSVKKEEPHFFFVNYERWLKHRSDILIFMYFSPDLKRCRIAGWLSGLEIENFTVKKLPYSLGYEIPKIQLKPFSALIEKWEVFKVKRK